jgi:outer membrane receptor for ferrienterochelin and colicin
MKRELLALVCAGVLSAPALRAADAGQGGEDGTTATAQAAGVTAPEAAVTQASAPDQKAEPKADEKVTRKEEVTVESASKSETTIVDAPATMSVVTGQTIANSPAQNYADLLRSVPGMNVIQTSARDLNLTR